MNDDELLARLRAADPARASAAPPPDLDRLLEAAMTTDFEPGTGTDPRPGSSRPAAGTPAGPRRRRLPAAAVAAAAAVVLAAGGITWAAASHGGSPAARSTPAASGTPRAGGVLKLTLPGGASGKCAAVSADILRGMPTAFEGTATAVGDDTVTLGVDHWYRGGDAPTVRLSSQSALAEQLSGVAFEVGGHYLVTAQEGRVSLCGFSGAADPQLRELFEQAFTTG